jgi:hypothetical protein
VRSPLGEVFGNLLRRQFDMVFIIVGYMLYGIRLLKIIEVDSDLSADDKPQVEVQLRVELGHPHLPEYLSTKEFAV